MYRDPKQWAYVRRLVLEEGGSRRGVSRKTGLSRKTVRKMLECPRPPSKPIPPDGAEEKLLRSARFLAAQRHSIDPIAYRRRALYLWARARDLVLQAGPATGRLSAPRYRRNHRWDHCKDNTEVSPDNNRLLGGGREYARYRTQRRSGSQMAGRFATRGDAACRSRRASPR